MLPRHERRQLARQAVKGRSTSAKTLIDCEPDRNKKAAIVLDLCRSKAPRQVVRNVLLRAIVGHPRCIQPEVAGSRELLRELFDYADYPKPRRDSTALFRGTAGIEAKDARIGYYWAGSRQTAVVYALCRAWDRGLFNPMIVEAQVADADVVVATESMGESPILDATGDHDYMEFLVLRHQDAASVEAITFEEAALNVPFAKKKLKTDLQGLGFDDEAISPLLGRIDEWLSRYKARRPSSGSRQAPHPLSTQEQ